MKYEEASTKDVNTRPICLIASQHHAIARLTKNDVFALDVVRRNRGVDGWPISISIKYTFTDSKGCLPPYNLHFNRMRNVQIQVYKSHSKSNPILHTRSYSKVYRFRTADRKRRTSWKRIMVGGVVIATSNLGWCVVRCSSQERRAFFGGWRHFTTYYFLSRFFPFKIIFECSLLFSHDKRFFEKHTKTHQRFSYSIQGCCLQKVDPPNTKWILPNFLSLGPHNTIFVPTT